MSLPGEHVGDPGAGSLIPLVMRFRPYFFWTNATVAPTVHGRDGEADSRGARMQRISARAPHNSPGERTPRVSASGGGRSTWRQAGARAITRAAPPALRAKRALLNATAVVV